MNQDLDGSRVRCLARTPSKATDLAEAGCEVVSGDVLDPSSLDAAFDGIDTACYLVHSMGRGNSEDFAAKDKEAASNFAKAAQKAGVKRIVYLGGLGEGKSEHLRSREETATALMSTGVPVTYLRAAVVVGGGSESFLTIYYLVKRLPIMVTPKWTTVKTQPIGVEDVVSYLVASIEDDSLGNRQIEIGGPTITTYGGMMDALAHAMKRRPPIRFRIPFLTPKLSSLWLGLVTPVDVGVARPLVEGLATETIVQDKSGMALFDIEPRPLPVAMVEAVSEMQADLRQS